MESEHKTVITPEEELAVIGAGRHTKAIGLVAMAEAMMALAMQPTVRMERRSAGLHPLLGVPEIPVEEYSRVKPRSTISPAKQAERKKKNKRAAASRRRNR